MAQNWKHVIISGGASGLGQGMAERLLRRGATVSVLDLAVKPERGAALDAAAAAGKSTWHFFKTDMTDEAGVKNAVAEAIALSGRSDLGINSAGIGLAQSFADMPSAAFKRMIEVNLMGSYHFAAALLPHLGKGDRLALIASMAGITSNYGYVAYGTSKFGVVGLATSLRYEYEPLGIHISCICPPEVMTPMVEAEYDGGNQIAIELKNVAGRLTLDQACDGIIAGLDKGQWTIIPGFKAKATAFLAQRMPGLFNAITFSLLRKIMRKHGMAVV